MKDKWIYRPNRDRFSRNDEWVNREKCSIYALSMNIVYEVCAVNEYLKFYKFLIVNSAEKKCVFFISFNLTMSKEIK